MKQQLRLLQALLHHGLGVESCVHTQPFLCLAHLLQQHSSARVSINICEAKDALVHNFATEARPSVIKQPSDSNLPSRRGDGSHSYKPFAVIAPSEQNDFRNAVSQRDRRPGTSFSDVPSRSQRSRPTISAQGSDQISDLALENAPTKHLSLIGDPRSGVADDVTSNPFGNTTVDLVHYQQSNEVYWYKYEFAAEQLKQTHRDSRLSDYSRNMMYLLRARDPSRWTIDALAQKFRVRPQRVLAILALKELEAQSMESGKSLQGPLSAYQCQVHLEDIILDQQGHPADLNSPEARRATDSMLQQAAETAANANCVLEQGRMRIPTAVHVPPGTAPLHCAIPRTRLVSRKVQQQLTKLLASYQFDLTVARSRALQPLDKSIETVRAQLPQNSQSDKEAADNADSAGSSSQPRTQAIAGSLAAAEQLLAALEAQQSAINTLFDKLENTLLQPLPSPTSDSAQAGTDVSHRAYHSELLEQEKSLLSSVHTVSTLLQQPTSLTAGQAGESSADNTQGSTQQQLEQVLNGLSDEALLNTVIGLKLPERNALLASMPAVAARLNALGGDLPALKTHQQHDATTNFNQQDQQLPIDVLGYAHVSHTQLDELVAAIETVHRCQRQVDHCMAVLSDGSHDTSHDSASGQVQWLRSLHNLRHNYQATVALVNQQQGGRFSSGLTPLKALRVMHEVDPGSLDRVSLVEAAKQLERAGDMATAEQIRAKLRGNAPPAAASDKRPPGTAISDDVGDPALGQRGAGDSVSWDILAAWLEAGPGGRTYLRGSGERHVARLPTYPAFEGAPLSALDKTEENSLSSLNRRVAQAQQEELQKRFAWDMLYNLGLIGDQLRDGHGQQHTPNLLSKLDVAPTVIYDITQDGKTVYPPLFVVEPDGSRRPLNEQEMVWQERRRRQVIPYRKMVQYTMNRIRRKPDLL